MDKKGQGISMNVIIIAAIALLVLVVVAAIFLVNMSEVSTEVGSKCLEAGGSCQVECQGNLEEIDGMDCGDGNKCCGIPGISSS
jgi:flagellar basal body-associated protein FliL